MNVVDSSGWLEYLADGPGADSFVAAIESADDLIVPTICMAEVARVLTRERDEHAALQALALMAQSRVVELDISVMLGAACLGVEVKLPLADSLILGAVTEAPVPRGGETSGGPVRDGLHGPRDVAPSRSTERDQSPGPER